MRDMLVHERLETIPDGFTLQGPAPPDNMLDLRFALVESDPQGLEAALYDVSTPASPNYGKYLTKEQVQCNFSATVCCIILLVLISKCGLRLSDMLPRAL